MPHVKNKQSWRGFLLPVALVAVWCIGSAAGVFNSYIIPSPQRVFSAFITLSLNGQLLDNMGMSLMRVMLGFFLAGLLASLLALLLFLCPWLGDYLQPTLNFIRHIPPLAIISLLILWFGIGETPKIVVVVLASFFPIFLNLCSGIQQCDAKLVEVGKAAGMSAFMLFKKIIFPSLFPFMMVGLQLGLSYGWRSLVGAELIAASSGLGYMIMHARELARSDIIIIGILMLGILGTIIDSLFLGITRRVLFYQKGNVAHYDMY